MSLKNFNILQILALNLVKIEGLFIHQLLTCFVQIWNQKLSQGSGVLSYLKIQKLIVMNYCSWLHKKFQIKEVCLPSRYSIIKIEKFLEKIKKMY